MSNWQWVVQEDGIEPVVCDNVQKAKEHIEQRGVAIWDALRDPNSNDAQPYPGLMWEWDDMAGTFHARMEGYTTKWLMAPIMTHKETIQ